MIRLAVPRNAAQLADDMRIALLRVLSPDGECAGCGHRYSVHMLEIDHVNGRTWVARTVSRLQRAKRHWQEFLTGTPLRAVCRHCNAIGGGRRYGRMKEAA